MSDRDRAERRGDGPALEVDDLYVDYRVRGVEREVLRGISFTVERGGRTAWSASPAAASRPPLWRRSATCRATGA